MADKVTVGNVEIMAVIDMVPPPRDPAVFFAGVSAADWVPYRADVLKEGQLQLYYGCFVVRSQGKVIMVDTGIGPGPHPDRGNLTGNLYEELRGVLLPPDLAKNTNVSPSDEVNIVVHTHLHVDHVGWNVRYSGGMPAPYFRRARYLVPRLDWEHFTKPENLAAAPYVQKSVVPLHRLRLMDLIDGEHHVTDEVTTLATPGHTPGHLAILISSQGEKAMIVGDVLHSEVQVQEPSWCAGVDLDKEASRKSREALLERAERENYVVAAGHFHPAKHIGRIVRLRGRRYWQAL